MPSCETNSGSENLICKKSVKICVLKTGIHEIYAIHGSLIFGGAVLSSAQPYM